MSSVLSLKPDGIGFVHHSNPGEYRRMAAVAKRLPAPLATRMIKGGWIVDVLSWRSEAMSAATFVELSAQASLACIEQEKVCWQKGRFLTDIFSVFTPRGSRWERPLKVRRNPGFRAEAEPGGEALRGLGDRRFGRAQLGQVLNLLQLPS